jgi:hypothetical protein
MNLVKLENFGKIMKKIFFGKNGVYWSTKHKQRIPHCR